jgi:DnaJ homolog subfamily B member 4
MRWGRGYALSNMYIASSSRRIPTCFHLVVLWVLLGCSHVGQVWGARKSYYDILGVPKTANEKEIQRAYRKLALQHHPDKGGEEEKFKELSSAYDCLSDAGKRQVYDAYGEAGLEHNLGGAAAGGGGFPAGAGSCGGFGAEGHPFHSFFSSSGPPGGGSNGGFRTETFSFGTGNPAGGGGNIDISQILREMMGGAGGGDGMASFFTEGPAGAGVRGAGGGSGFSSSSTRRRPPQQQYKQPLKCTLEDLATGRTKKLKVSLPHGPEKVFEVAIKPGWKAGTKITYPASTDFPASMVFEVAEVPHPYLRREGNDLYYTCWIDPSQTQGGIKVRVPLPTGEVWSRHIPKKDKTKKKHGGDDPVDVLSTGKQLRIASKGMPIKGGPERGDLIVQFRVRRSTR